jgi:DNA-binding MarR family transcriptional regulator
MERDHVDALTDQWARERPELDTRGLAVSARVVRLQRHLDRRIREVLTRFDLHEGEANVLAALRRAGAPHELTPSELSRSLLLSSGAMTNRLDRLEARGLLVRVPDPQDGRRVRVRLTDAGQDVVDAAMDAHTAALAEQLGFLAEDERRALEGLLRRVLSVLDVEHAP